MGLGSRDEAIAAWKAKGTLRAIFESGGGGPPGEPTPTFEHAFAKWPPAETQPLRLYAQPDGSLGAAMPVAATNPAPKFALDPEAGDRGILASGSVWDLIPNYNWRQPAAGSAVIFLGEPLAADQVMFGNASVDLWLRSQVDDADLEVTITEVRPDGQEMYVQSGWLRASLRGSGPNATPTWPAPTFMEADSKKLVPNEWTSVRVGTAGFQHVFRAGSRIRVSIDTPGDTRAEWRFDLAAFPANTTYEIGVDSTHPTSIALPVVTGVTAPSTLPACPSLRGQQCRAFVPYTNVTSN
jgi:predicted acyl esterase